MVPIKDPITGKVLVDVLQGMIAAAIRTNRRVSYKFNGIELFADPTTQMEALVEQYQTEYQNWLGRQQPITLPVPVTPPVFPEVVNWEDQLTLRA